MNKTAKTLIITASILVIIAILVLVNFLKGKVSTNPDDFVGNTASNLYNGGYFCEYDGKVYFANSNADGALYVMNSDETKADKLSDTSVISINADDSRVYYSMSANTNGSGLGYIRKSAGLYSINHSGHDSICYTTNPVASALLYGNKLYYQNYQKTSGTSIFSIETDRTNNHEVLRQMVSFVDPYGGLIYYGNMDNNHYLYAFDPVTEASGAALEKDVYMPVMDENGWLYYMDPTTNYSLKRYNMSSGEEQTLSTERLEFFNKYGDFIYYQINSKSPTLRRMFYDGSNDTVIAEGNYTKLQTTSNYAYFVPFENQSITYHVSHYGSVNVEPFMP